MVAKAKKSNSAEKRRPTTPTNPHRFEAAKLEALFSVLDAIAWLEAPSANHIAQFAGIDPRTAGKLLKNALQIGLIDQVAGSYNLLLPYPYKGSKEQKEALVREALVKLPLLTAVRNFLQLGDDIDVSLRKSATIVGAVPYNSADFAPLIVWARSLNALIPSLIAEDLVDHAENIKEQRHKEEKSKRVAFLSHSSLDKPFMRQLASDLNANGIAVWLDEQRIRVGESIPDKIAQGLADSDYFLIGISRNSTSSEWVKKELNGALVTEIQRRKVHVLPLKIDDSKIPAALIDKKYADFSNSYKSGLSELLSALKEDIDG